MKILGMAGVDQDGQALAQAGVHQGAGEFGVAVVADHQHRAARIGGGGGETLGVGDVEGAARNFPGPGRQGVEGADAEIQGMAETFPEGRRTPQGGGEECARGAALAASGQVKIGDDRRQNRQAGAASEEPMGRRDEA